MQNTLTELTGGHWFESSSENNPIDGSANMAPKPRVKTLATHYDVPIFRQIPVSSVNYTGSVVKLLWADFWSFWRLIRYVRHIFSPMTPWKSGELLELSPTKENIWCIVIHAVLAVAQFLFVASIFVWPFFPLWTVMLYVASFIFFSKAVCQYLLNRGGPGYDGRLQSDSRFLTMEKKGSDEEWIYINGVSIGTHWLQSNINHLSLLFQRPVVGIHNRTNGIVFDLIQCLIERSFSFCTTDIRAEYTHLTASLLSPKKKIVLILHSQGGIHGGLNIDWLLQQFDAPILRKLEVYTFGAAANHFNNPGGVIPHVEHYANSDDFVARWGILHSHNPLEEVAKSSSLRHEARHAGGARRIAFTEPRTALQGAEVDPAARAARGTYRGTIFELPRGGHMLGQHYLDRLFPQSTLGRTDSDLTRSGLNPWWKQLAGWPVVGAWVAGAPETDVMDLPVVFDSAHDAYRGEKVVVHDESAQGASGRLSNGGGLSGGLGTAEQSVGRNGRVVEGPLKLRHLSRLAQYLGGGSPAD
jgi:hypothetical protein